MRALLLGIVGCRVALGNLAGGKSPAGKIPATERRGNLEIPCSHSLEPERRSGSNEPNLFFCKNLPSKKFKLKETR